MAGRRERVLITGGSGFVGACLARAEIAEGHDVHLILRPQAQLWRLSGIEGHYTPHRADLCDAQALRQAVAEAQPEVIHHLAAHGAYPTQKDRAAILAANLLGTINLLDALQGQDYRALIHTGSSSEYGHKSGPMHEDDRLEPRSDYGVTKAAATLLCQAEALRGRPVTTVRIFSAYGPWEDPTRLVPYVMDCCWQGIDPKVSAGWQPRDFIYVDDVVALLQRAAHQDRPRGQILHAATGQQHTVRDMVETIVAVCGQGRVHPQFGTESVRPDEPTSWLASIDRTTALTGCRPQHDLRSGIAGMWSWFQNTRKRGAA